MTDISDRTDIAGHGTLIDGEKPTGGGSEPSLAAPRSGADGPIAPFDAEVDGVVGRVEPSLGWRGRDQHAYDRFRAWAEWPMLVLSLLFVPTIVMPLVISVNGGVDNILNAASWLIWGVFAAEYLLLLWLAPRRLKMVRAHLFDLAIILLPFLRPLRAGRGLRILRVPFAAGGLGRVVTLARRITTRRGVQTFVGVVAGSVVLGAAAVYGLEYEHPESEFNSFLDVLWWATFTATTIGRTDTYPVTVEGQIIAIALMALRVSLLAMITAHMAAYFVEIEEQEENAEIISRLDQIERAIPSRNDSSPSHDDLVDRLDRIERLLTDRDPTSA